MELTRPGFLYQRKREHLREEGGSDANAEVQTETDGNGALVSELGGLERCCPAGGTFRGRAGSECRYFVLRA